MIKRLFLDHPADVDETYYEHLRTASGFAITMQIGALACFIHALVPGLFARRGGDIIRKLHDRMVLNRRRTMIAVEQRNSDIEH